MQPIEMRAVNMTIRSMEGPWNGIQLKINGLAHTQSVNADPAGADD
jgi:hypothetical protein